MFRPKLFDFLFSYFQFFGFGLDHIRKMLETCPGVEAVVAPLTNNSPKYRFCFNQPQLEAVKDLIRKRAAEKAEKALENSSGCARTEGIKAVARSGGSGRITRALVRSAEEDVVTTFETGSAITKKGEEKAKVDRNLIQVKYKRMKSVPLEQRLASRRSHIHGWGLFNKGPDIPKDDPIVEYMGEIIRQPIADKRERAYEISGEGSCYMFRLDLHRIVDATKIGCMARFMNHSCQPNAYAKIITVDTESGADRKIVVFANRDIASGEEITYGER
jgi:SET domain